MRTGFTNAFPNKPLNKYYMYHGILMPCNIQPDPEPFKSYEMPEEIPTWIRTYCNLKVVWPYFYLEYKAEDFLPSRWLDLCTRRWPDGFERYYFLELYIQKVPEYPEILVDLNYGNDCDYLIYHVTEEYEHIAMWFKLYSYYKWIFRVKVTEAAHTSRVWRTSDGNLNMNWPVPLDWKY